jgi:hypothetical protein
MGQSVEQKMPVCEIILVNKHVNGKDDDECDWLPLSLTRPLAATLSKYVLDTMTVATGVLDTDCKLLWLLISQPKLSKYRYSEYYRPYSFASICSLLVMLQLHLQTISVDPPIIQHPIQITSFSDPQCTSTQQRSLLPSYQWGSMPKLRH